MTDDRENGADAIAARMREKIRLQALELLEKADSIEKTRQQPQHNDNNNNLSSSTSSNNNPLLATPPTESKPSVGSSFVNDFTGAFTTGISSRSPSADNRQDGSSPRAANVVVAGSAPPLTSPTNNGNSIKHSTSSTDLTKRLQKLALERQLNSSQNRLKVIQSDVSSHLSSAKTFQELNLPNHLLDAIFTMGFDRPSAIQEEALPRILANPPRNVIAQAQSGSGKTAAFTLGMLVRINVDQPPTVQALCVTPTRELAIQIVDKAIAPMACNMPGLKIQLAISQSNIADKKKGLDAHLVVGTPGKIVDWLKRKIINPNTIQVFVLDEADHMVEEGGHRANSLLIKSKMPSTCQSLLFSATFPESVINFATKMITNPDKILIEDGKPEYLVLDVIKQLWIDTRSYGSNPATSKLEFLADIYSLLTIGQSIVFVGRKDEADLVYETLTQSGYTCSVLHSRVEATDRDETMEQFRNGKSNVLITTNVLARGVDVDNVCLVVNYDVPTDKDGMAAYETYLHRIGRTGRFGRKGTAITLIQDDQSMQILQNIERHFTGDSNTNTSTNNDNKRMITEVPADPEALADMIEI